MEIKELEALICKEIEKVIIDIIKNNRHLNISAKSRAGAEISDWLEEQFVIKTKDHKFLKNSESSPKGSTKNPWDAKTFFHVKNLKEEIWIDFKALKLTSADSNPDIGTPDKIIKFIKAGSFYLLYVYVYYQEDDTGLSFVENEGNLVKSYFLKDISSTVRRNPKNQLQVNMSQDPEYRTREEFISLLIKKIRESHDRQMEISRKKLNQIDKIEAELKKINKTLEKSIEENLK